MDQARQQRDDIHPIPERVIEEIAERAAAKVLATMQERDERIAEKAVDLTIKKFYTEVGRSVVERALWLIGVGVVALLIWLAGTGRLGG